MKNIIILSFSFLLLCNLTCHSKDSRWVTCYSINSLNPFGMALAYTGEKNFYMLNWNTGWDYGYTGYRSRPNTGIYKIGEWGNRKIGETSSIHYDREIISFSIGRLISGNEKTKHKIYFFAGPAIYSVRSTKFKWAVVRCDWGVLDDYVVNIFTTVERENPVVLTSGVFINYKITEVLPEIGLGLGFNTAPVNSGSPIRTNVLLGISIPF